MYDFVDAFKEGFLDVGDGHELYYEVSGNPEGVPVVRLHGGPGSNSKPKHKQAFDPEKYCVVLFDQRGCGKSKPYGSIFENTTQKLISDIEKLREHLGFEGWVVTGGSWGSTLALLYAQAYPDRVMALGVYGIFLAEKSDVDWIYGEEGAARLFPEHYATFIEGKPEGVSAFDCVYNGIFNAPSEGDAKRMAVQFLTYMGKLCGMEYSQMVEQQAWEEARKQMDAEELAKSQTDFENFALTHARLELYYEKNHFFIDEGQILRDMHKISHIPLFICHGRYDAICPASGAYSLSKAHPKAQLTIVPTAGHSSSEMESELLDMFNKKIINSLVK